MTLQTQSVQRCSRNTCDTRGQSDRRYLSRILRDWCNQLGGRRNLRGDSCGHGPRRGSLRLSLSVDPRNVDRDSAWPTRRWKAFPALHNIDLDSIFSKVTFPCSWKIKQLNCGKNDSEGVERTWPEMVMRITHRLR